MSLDAEMKFRLPVAMKKRYLSAAAAAGLDQSTWIRRELERSHELSRELAQLRQLIAHQVPTTGRVDEGEFGVSRSVAIETLYLLRSLAGGDTLRTVHSEMKRLGLDVHVARSHRIE